MALVELGDVGHIRSIELPVPEPASDEVLVRVATVAANRQDINLILRRFVVPTMALPHVLGLDPAGVVVAVGSAVTAFGAGQRVIVKPAAGCGVCEACRGGEDDACERSSSVGIHRPGGMAEFVSVPVGHLFAMPDSLSFAAATAVAHSFPVALTLLRRVGVASGQTVMVSGAAGSVGGAVVQLARRLGCRVVALASSQAGMGWLQGLPDHLAPSVVIESASAEGLGARIRDAAPAGIDVHVETASDPQIWQEALPALRKGGRVAVVGSHAGPIVAVDNNWLFRQRVSIVGCSGSSRAAFAEALDLAAGDRIVPRVDDLLPLADAAVAYRRLIDRQNQGKLVLSVSDDLE